MKGTFRLPARVVVALATALLAAPVISAEGDVSFTASATAKGKPADVLFQKYCSICHGEKGDGKSRVIKSMSPPPRDFTTREAAQELSRERMINSIKHGRPGTAMVSHARKLSDNEIASIADYIRTTFMQLPENKNFTAAPTQQAAPTSSPHQQNIASAAAAKPAQTKSSPQHKRGGELFKKNCSSCHGDRGNTAVWARSGLNPAPRDFTSAEAKSDLTRERMINSVTNGRPGTAMMAFSKRLSKQDIEDVVSFIRAEFMQIDDVVGGAPAVVTMTEPKAPAADPHAPAADPHAPAADPHRGPHDRAQSSAPAAPPMAMAGPADMSKDMPGGLKSDKDWGEEFYMNNCYVCHGKKGDGKGPRSHFITPRPRNFTSDESRRAYNRPRLFDAIKKGKRGTVMPAWGTVLSDQQIANVTEFVFQAFIRGEGEADKKSKSDDKTSSVDTSEKKKASLTAGLAN